MARAIPPQSERDNILWECWISFDRTKHEQIYQWALEHGGWYSQHPCGAMFWIPADRVWYLHLLDSSALREPERDYVG